MICSPRRRPEAGQFSTLATVADAIRAYLHSHELGHETGGVPNAARSPAPTTVPQARGEPGDPPVIPAERLDVLRRELPPPMKSTDSGRKTHGRWIGPDGVAQPIVSGVDDDSRAADQRLRQLGIPMRPAKASDVEMKVAARMVRDGMTHATVLINNTPCRGRLGCDTLVPIMLPDGATLTVHGVNEDGTLFRKRYTGGARPWWR
ncbi:DddA-like double-stranded DNA deaminase toxin [Lentzea sp. NPDC054927]